MKNKSVAVRSDNMANVYGRIQKFLKRRVKLKTRDIYVKSVNEAHSLLNTYPLSTPLFQGRKLLVSAESCDRIGSITIENRSYRDEDFIAIRVYNKTGVLLIYVGDKVTISKQGIFVEKKENASYRQHVCCARPC